jgi:hypothetical protein
MEKCTTIQRLRKPKVADMSIFDWVTSLIAAFAIGRVFGIKSFLEWLLFIILWIVFGITAHWAFNVPTMLGYYLGINEKPVRKECEV